MRIPLVSEQTGSRRRTRPMARRSRKLDSAAAIPRTPGARGRARSSTGARRSAKPRTPTPAARTVPRQHVATKPRRRVSWRAVARRVPVFLVALAALGAVAYAFTDARFFVYQGHIVGASHLDAVTIYEAAEVHEQSIFWVDPGTVAERVAQVVGVKEVQVRCELPARVTITIEERQPRILWRAVSQERDWWLDESGVVLPYHGDPDAPDVIYVVDYAKRALTVGQRVTPYKLVRSVISLVEAMPDVRLYTYDPERGLGFTQEMPNGKWPVYVGSSEDLSRKI